MKPTFSFSIALLIAGFMVTMFSCKREDVDYIGPAYVSAPEGFSVSGFSASTPAVDFSSGTVDFDATFSHAASWTLTITGQQSGAVSMFTGTSNGLSNIIWRGNHDGVAFFKTGETVTATLSFFGTTYTSSTNVTITVAPDFRTCGQFANWADFENPSKINHANAWHAFNDPTPIPNVVQGVGSNESDYKGNTVSPIQGNNYYFIRGLGNQANFVSGIQYDAGTPLSPVLPADANNVWVNMYIYGTGDANAQVELEYQEADIDGSTAGYQGTDDDAFVAKFTLEHKGWKLFSFQYSKLTPSLNADFGGSGNKIHEPHRLRSFDLILVKKSNPDSPVEVYFDYPIITVGGPFKPCN